MEKSRAAGCSLLPASPASLWAPEKGFFLGLKPARLPGPVGFFLPLPNLRSLSCAPGCRPCQGRSRVMGHRSAVLLECFGVPAAHTAGPSVQSAAARGGGLCLAGASPKREGSQDLGLVGSLVAVGGDSRVLSLCGQGLAPRILRTRDGAGPCEPPTAPISALMEPPPFPAGDTPLIRGHWETLPMSATWEQVQREPHTWGLLPTLLPCKPLRAGHLLPWAPRAGPLPSDFGHIPGTSCSQ